MHVGIRISWSLNWIWKLKGVSAETVWRSSCWRWLMTGTHSLPLHISSICVYCLIYVSNVVWSINIYRPTAQEYRSLLNVWNFALVKARPFDAVGSSVRSYVLCSSIVSQMLAFKHYICFTKLWYIILIMFICQNDQTINTNRDICPPPVFRWRATFISSVNKTRQHLIIPISSLPSKLRTWDWLLQMLSSCIYTIGNNYHQHHYPS